MSVTSFSNPLLLPLYHCSPSWEKRAKVWCYASGTEKGWLEMIPSLLQSYLAANIASAAKDQVGDYQLLCACSHVASLISLPALSPTLPPSLKQSGTKRRKRGWPLSQTPLYPQDTPSWAWRRRRLWMYSENVSTDTSVVFSLGLIWRILVGTD